MVRSAPPLLMSADGDSGRSSTSVADSGRGNNLDASSRIAAGVTDLRKAGGVTETWNPGPTPDTPQGSDSTRISPDKVIKRSLRNKRTFS